MTYTPHMITKAEGEILRALRDAGPQAPAPGEPPNVRLLNLETRGWVEISDRVAQLTPRGAVIAGLIDRAVSAGRPPILLFRCQEDRLLLMLAAPCGVSLKEMKTRFQRSAWSMRAALWRLRWAGFVIERLVQRGRPDRYRLAARAHRIEALLTIGASARQRRSHSRRDRTPVMASVERGSGRIPGPCRSGNALSLFSLQGIDA